MSGGLSESGSESAFVVRAAGGIALVSLLFSLAVGALLVSDYMRMRSSDPLSSRTIEELRERLKENPDDDLLREGIRDLDMMSRGVFFASRSKLLAGRALLIAGLVVCFVSANVLLWSRWRFPLPGKCPGIDNSYSNAAYSRRLLLFLGAPVLVAIFMPAVWRGGFSRLDERSVQEALAISEEQGSVALVAVIPSGEQILANWPGFRGSYGQGIAHREDVPGSWDGATSANVFWRVEIPKPGFSSPVVWEDKVFVTGGDAGSRRVFLFDAKDGRLVWQREVCGIIGSPSTLPPVTADTGYAAASPATDGMLVFAIFANGDLICYDFAGEVIWSRNLGTPDNHYGHSSSLLVEKGVLIVQFDHRKSTSLIGIECATGKDVWRQSRGEDDISWSSPIFVRHGDRDAVISCTSTTVFSNDLATGREFWRRRCLAGEVAPSPSFQDGVVFVTNDNASTVALDFMEGNVLWENNESLLPDVASPVVCGDFIILATSMSVVVCLNSRTGKLLWEHDVAGGFYSSPILVNGLVYVTDMNGTTYIIKPGEKYEEIVRLHLKDQIVATPAFVGNKIFIRGAKHLYCIQNGQPRLSACTAQAGGHGDF